MKNKTKIYIIIGTVLIILLLLIVAPIIITKAQLAPLKLVRNNESIEEVSEDIRFNQKVYTGTTPLSKEEIDNYANKRLSQLDEEKKELIAENADPSYIKEYDDTKIIMEAMNNLYKEDFWQILYDLEVDLETSGIRDGSVYPNSPEARLYTLLMEALSNKGLSEDAKNAIKDYLKQHGSDIKNNDELKQKVLDTTK